MNLEELQEQYPDAFLITTTNGGYAILDKEDYELQKQYNWQSGSKGVVYRCDKKRKPYGVYLHREVVQCPSGLQVDHINGDPKDNRKCNLRICTNQENARNKKPTIRSSIGFKGVYPLPDRVKSKNKFAASIKVLDKGYFLGVFETAEEAARAWDEKAIELHGEFVLTNEKLGLFKN